MTAAARLSPVAAGERIEELDVVRGFALLGIFLMNVEFFNRSIMGIGEGMPPGLTGIDWVAGYFIAYFVQGKFWTIFSLLFGMGFAVMLTRAERAGRPFLAAYLRRILALAVFGALHFIFVWSGDILFAYAIAAGGLLVLMYGKWKFVLLGVVILVGVAFVPGLSAVAQTASSLAFVGLLAIYMRSEKKIFSRIPLFSFFLLIIGILGALIAVALWMLPDAPEKARFPTATFSAFMLIAAFLSARYRTPVELRGLRLGVSVYVMPALLMMVIGVARYVSADVDDPPPVTVAMAGSAASTPAAGPPAPEPPPGPRVTVVAHTAGGNATDGKTASSEGTSATDAKTASSEGKPAADKKAVERRERAQQVAKYYERRRNEERVLSQGTYADAVDMRARSFPARLAGETGLAVIVLGMFLIGIWFVRSGVMENVGAHMRLFRRLALYGLPLGIGLGVLGSLITTSHLPGDMSGTGQIAGSLSMLGSLPACLGYVGLIVVALHSRTRFAKVRVLAPAGRMALTNYLMQSVISTFVFYGYGAGWWGLARSWQVVYVVGVFALQVAFSHWWLARFRYGPMEWLWRAFTYRQSPSMRLAPAATLTAPG